ncbi:hypothetical protein LRB67_05240 [Borreliella bissettiae]|uniref:hypothetical protein n=1 Tax=Borrelia bissettiae TaxID=64897 RepID=UPI001E3E7DF6|nr:hypothetical protein [Borreliella bissettiae]MCD2401658.1 hypothetical protein [Borreliella bissettiae]
MNKLLIFIILLVFSCNLSNSDQNNPLNMSNKEKISEYQINESQIDTQLSNEIQAFKGRSSIYATDSSTSNSISYPDYIQTILKIEKQVDGKIFINEVTNENSKKTTKLLEIEKEDIYILKNAIKFGGGFKAKDTRENQSDKKVSPIFFISNYREYIQLEMPTTITNTNSSQNYNFNKYMIQGDNLLRIISNL